ncbi:GFA family protein [Alteromonas lipolytica]|uniref:CENP-V/GFA domain-containing protein n=1 Tax=Alteromonas lipolytica TaxID=1856405 RepID=A0A1E8FBB3_9ALTE|nr:GFA family protein [Alteromonas lipolytica]OFI32898.1 hypothetical protein BFC17_01080 [Alteromonas lipolytica]GGF64385.1 aldehyde-activating protein [Alteromonas lipolytica]
MSDQPVMQAKCLCQSVNIELTPKSLEIGACHCETCRQWSGSPYLAIESEKADFSGDTIATYESSEWAERGFCKQCGTHLFYKLKGADSYYVPVGLFAEINSMAMTHQLFIDSKPTYYNFAEQTVCMTGAEVFASIAGE